MNLIKAILTNIWNFIQRNPLTVMLIVLLAFGAPWVLGIFALILLVPVVLIAVSLVPMIRSMRHAQRAAEEQYRQSGDASARRNNPHGKREGDITVVATDMPAPKKVSEDVGEYVDFKEVK